MGKKDWIIWGTELSSFYLKVLATMHYFELPVQRQPMDGGTLKALMTFIRVNLIQKGISKLTWPNLTEMDELPLVPYMFSPAGEKFYDSTAFANWLDTHKNARSKSFVGSEDPVAEFVIALIDEYGDEIGPYMAHHQRWVCSAADTEAGQSLANDFHHIIRFGVNRELQQTFPVRQIARLPYLFSVAPTGFHNEKLPDNQQAPQREGFPPTHDFIENAYDNLLDALEAVLAKRSYLLGNRFTLADASISSELNVHILNDPTTRQHITEKAPETRKWLDKISLNDFSGDDHQAELVVDQTLALLLAEINRFYIPLMEQNEAAYLSYLEKGERVFNEAAFMKNRAIYEGEIDGTKFRHVAKSFQVKSWRSIKEKWQRLNADQQGVILDIAPLGL